MSRPASGHEARLRPRRVLFAVSAMGFGHVQRSLPLIRRLLADGARMTLVSDGDALAALRRELAGHEAVEFRSFPDYPPLQRGEGAAHYGYFLADLLRLTRRLRLERAFTNSLVAEIRPDLIVTDGRFGFHAPGVPSFLICHQIRFIMPRLLRPFQLVADLVQLNLLRRFDRVLVPDFASAEACLAGRLSHNWIAALLKPAYVGHLSSAHFTPAEKNIDLLFITGGFLKGPKAAWEAWIARLAHEHEAREIVSIAGSMGHEAAWPDRVKRQDFVLGTERDDYMNRARAIIARAGYTTIMDLVVLRQDAILIPTPGMTEQLYLAKRHPRVEIGGQTGYAFRYAALPEAIRAWNVEDTLKTILGVIGWDRHVDCAILKCDESKCETPQ